MMRCIVSVLQAEQGWQLKAAAMLSSLLSVRWAQLLRSELKQPCCMSQAEAWIMGASCKCSGTPFPAWASQWLHSCVMLDPKVNSLPTCLLPCRCLHCRREYGPPTHIPRLHGACLAESYFTAIREAGAIQRLVELLDQGSTSRITEIAAKTL